MKRTEKAQKFFSLKLGDTLYFKGVICKISNIFGNHDEVEFINTETNEIISLINCLNNKTVDYETKEWWDDISFQAINNINKKDNKTIITTTKIDTDNTQKQLEKIAREVGYKGSEVKLVINTIAKGATFTELKQFLTIAKSSGLNPFLGEIYFIKDKTGKLWIFAGKNGFLKMAHDKDPQFKSLNSFEVCENDEFSREFINGEMVINHKIDDKKPRGKIIGAYAIYLRKDGGKCIEWADIKTYYKEFKNVTTPWQTHTAEMMKKVPLTHACKQMVSIGEIYTDAEFNIDYKKNLVVLDQEKDDLYSNELRETINKISTIEELNKFYDDNKAKYNKNTFNKLIIQRKDELKDIQQ